MGFCFCPPVLGDIRLFGDVDVQNPTSCNRVHDNSRYYRGSLPVHGNFNLKFAALFSYFRKNIYYSTFEKYQKIIVLFLW